MPELFNLSVKADVDVTKVMRRFNLNEGGKIQKIIDSEVLSLNDPYVPKVEGQLIRSGQQNTTVGSGEVIYSTPYARKQYYILAKHSEGRCAYWFEQMKNSGGKEKILNAARKAVGRK
ncbi:MAG: minor capsid protein [Bacteroidales bacterium]|nr:minor capsid protein [Clostridium sp.]MCM1204746.1 minor capsid protein [Bacteroidales bacterium]